MRRLLLTTVFGLSLISAAQAATVWDEAVSGDLANVGTSPTALVMLPGSNLISGTTGRTSGTVDRDYFSFTVPAGWQLETLTVLPGSSFLGASGLSFIAVQAGPQVTVSPTGGSAAGLLGWVHYSENDLGGDILGLMGIGGGAIGFAGALPAATYAFWVQDTGTGVANYRFDFKLTAVSPVPEPSAALLLLGGLAALVFSRRTAWTRRTRPSAMRLALARH